MEAIPGTIDLYCERIDVSYWAEPFNAVTNAAFLIAAYVAFLGWRRSAQQDLPALVLIINLVAIGVGSYLFHTHANRATMVMDVLPILIFILIYLGMAMRRYFMLALWLSVLIAAFYIPLSALSVPVLGPIMGSSASYGPALFALVIIGILLLRTDPLTGRGLLIAAAVFTLSIAFRMADQPICPAFALGTHFIWHIFNAVVLFQLVRVLVAKGRLARYSPAL